MKKLWSGVLGVVSMTVFSAAAIADCRLLGDVRDASNQPVAGVGLTLPGLPVSSVTNASGQYSLFVGNSGAYTVYAYKNGFVPAPASSVEVTANHGSDTAVPTIFLTASGGAQYGVGDFKVYNSAGTPAFIADVTLTGAPGGPIELMTGNGGIFISLAAGNYTLTAVKSGYTFQPPSWVLTGLSVNISNLAFTATAQEGGGGGFSISGTIVNGQAQGVPGITLRVDGGHGAMITEITVTDGSGAYNTTAVLSGGIDYEITPLGGTFNPASYVFTNLGSNQTNQNFVMTGGQSVGGGQGGGGGTNPGGGFGSGFDGRGSISLTPTDPVGASALGTWTVVYTVPNEKLMPGGGVRFDMPWGWTDPQNTNGSNPGYITVTNSAGVNQTVTVTNNYGQTVVYVQFTLTLSAGTSVTLVYGSTSVNSGGKAQAASYGGQYNEFRVSSDLDGVENGFDVGFKSFNQVFTYPPLNIVVFGAPAGIRFGAQQQSGLKTSLYAAVIQTADQSGGKAGNATSPIYITLETQAVDPESKIPTGAARTSLTLFGDAGGTVALSGPLMITTGTSSITLYYKDVASGLSKIQAAAELSLEWGLSQSTPFVDIVTLDGGIGGVSIDTGELGAMLTATLTPDSDGVNDFAFINFTLEAESDWQVIIDTNRDDAFAESFNWNVAGDLAFYGRATQNRIQVEPRDPRRYQLLPNGVYPVRIALGSWGADAFGQWMFIPSSIINTALSMVVTSVGLTGTVYDNLGNKVENAQVNVGGAGFGFGSTNSLGVYSVYGLKAGVYHVNVRKSGFAEANLDQTLPSSGDTALNITLDKGGSLRVVAIRPSSQYAFEIWGGVEVHASNGMFGGFGPLHFTAGNSTISDNGWYDVYDSNNYKNYSEIGLGTGTYSVRLNGISGLGVASWTQGGTTLATSTKLDGLQITGAVDMTLTVYLDKRPGISGVVTLTEANQRSQYGQFVSVWAHPKNSPYDWENTVYGGAFFQQGTGTQNFELPGVSAGTYTVKARAEGFVEYTHNVDVVVTASEANPSTITISNFSHGASITGVFAMPGNTLSQWVWLNIFSPQNGFGGGAQVEITGASAQYAIGGLAAGTYEINTFLSGYEMDNFANGSHAVTIPNGVEYVTQNITMTAFSGAISGEVFFPAGDTLPAYQNIRIFVNQLFGGPEFGGGGGGFQNNTFTLSFENGKYTFHAGGLGTGAYNVATIFQFDPNNPNKFYTSQNKAVRVENGKSASVSIQLGNTVFDVSGKVTTKSTNTKWNTISKITANATKEQNFGGGAGKSIFRVVALPINELGEGGGLGSSFGSGQAGGLGFFGEITPSTLDATVGEYTIPKLAPGAYKLFVPGQLSLAAMGGPGNMGMPSAPDIVSSEILVVVKNADVSGQNLEIGDGYKVSGTVTIPTSESQNFYAWLNVFQPGKSGFFRGLQLTITAGSTSKTYSVDKLNPGKYTVQVFSEKYAIGAKSVEIVASDATANIELKKGANIKGKLRDVDSNTPINSQNASQYLGGVNIYAQANPWVEGGYREAERSHSGGFQGGSYSISSAGYFSINNLPAGTYDVVVQCSPGFDQSTTKNYAPKVIAGVVVSDDDASNNVNKELSTTIDLKRGEQVKGRVTDKATGLPLSNILVAAFPSNKGGFNTNVSTRTDAEGNFTLLGLDEEMQYFTVVASPRGQRYSRDLQFDMFMRDAEKFGEARKDDIDISVPENRVNINFALSKANGSLSGSVYTADGGALIPPDLGGKGDGLQIGAKIYLQDVNDINSDDPLGDIFTNSQADGTFYLDGLVPGTVYNGRVMAKGYSVKLFKVNVSGAGTTTVPALTLATGGKVEGTVLKPSGSKPNTNEVGGVVAVTDDFSEILFGSVESDSTTKLVSKYSVDGLVPGTTYNLIVFPQNQNQSGPPDNMIDAGTVMVTLASETKTVNIVYKTTGPTFIAQFQKSGTSMLLKFFSTQALRNLTEDDKNAAKIITVKSGAGSGSLTGQTISADRRTVTATYTPAAGETKFTINLKAYSNTKDVLTGDNFLANEDFEFFLGFDGQGVENVNNLLGGEVKIAGDQTKASFGQGSFSGAKISKVKVELYKVSASSSGAPRHAPGAYPVQSFKRFAKAPTLSGVFSNYYDVFLKTGQLAAGKTYSLALAYDSSVTDTSNLNVYYLDETSNQWKKEDTSRKIDTTNRTISVQLNHASRFVVVNSSAATIGGSAYMGSEFTAFNYPNPFDLNAKSVTLSKAAGGGTATITGTEIRYTLPSAMTGDVTFTFYNLAGEKVRTIKETNKPGGYYYYVEWDGKNDDGSEVASGVYICIAKAPGATKTFKLAVIK